MLNNFGHIKNALAAARNLENCEIIPVEESRKGDGVIAVINRVTFTGIDSNNQLHKENLILKTAPTHEIYRKSSPIHEMYQNEIYAYRTILPTLREKYENLGLKFVNFPECYLSNSEEDSEYLVFEDLTCDGFKLWRKQETMDDDHLFMVLENLAKFHSASILLKKKYSEVWKNLIGNLNDVTKKFFCGTDFCEAIVDLAKTIDPILPDQNDASNRFKMFRDNEMREFLCEFCNQTDSESVIVHGDLWCNNILFKYGDATNPAKPTDIALLDFQGIRLSSIAVDLSYFLYISCSKQSMSAIEKYLQYYYEKLSENLIKMDLDPDLIFPKSSLLSQWKRYNKFGLAMGLVTLHGVNSDSDEFPSLEDVLNGGKTFWFALNFKSRHEDKYQERIKDVIMHFIERDYIRKLDGCLWSKKLGRTKLESYKM